MGRASRTFVLWLVAMAALGFTIRASYVLFERTTNGLEAKPGVVYGDAAFYYYGADLLWERGFIQPAVLRAEGRVEQAADHPPLYLVWLAIPRGLGVDSPGALMLWSALLGTLTVIATGLLGREVAGERAGVLAALLAAIYPNVWVHDGFLMSETPAILTATMAVLLTYRYRRRPTTAAAIALGAMIALAALSRAELILLFPLLVLPAVLRDRRLWWRRLLVTGAATGVVVAPWVGLNMVRFSEPAFLSTGFDITLLSATCDRTYYGPGTGYWDFVCVQRVREAKVDPLLDQVEEGKIFRREALDYMGDHLRRLPVVILARWGRITGLWNSAQQVRFDHFPEGREVWVAELAERFWFPVAGLSIVGAVVLRRRRSVAVLPLLATPITVLVATTIMFGQHRYRAPAETSLCVLAAVAVDAGVRALLRRRAAPAEAEPAGVA